MNQAFKTNSHQLATQQIAQNLFVFIDSGIEDYELLVEGILPTAEAIVLSKHRDGIAQISEVLRRSPTSVIQLIAHGGPGSLQLGSQQLNLENLHTYRPQLQQWQAAEILIYGCEVAADERGQAFIQKLHQYTGANIAASSGKIGNAQHGGGWELEVKVGKIAANLALKPEVTEAYPGVLVTFSTATKFSVGTNPASVAVGDFNKDGKQDLAVANFDNNNVSVLLSNGIGGFATATNFSVGTNPASVAVADFDKDGIPDLAVANVNSNNVSVLLGLSTGGFATATNFSVGSGPYSVAVGDFNGDGKQDLAVANHTDNNVSVLLGDGTGGFDIATNYSVGSNPYSVAVGDFNGDGKQDLAVANYGSNNVSVLLSLGTGDFATATNFSVGTNPGSLAVGDFNKDGKQDLAVANVNSNNVSVLLSLSTGGFATATNFSVGKNPGSLAVGDFNKDGIPDLAVANVNSNNISVLLGTGTGGFATATNFSVGANPSSLAVGDFNGDGKQDLVVTNFNYYTRDNTVSVLLNTTPSASLTNPSASLTNPSASLTNISNDVFNLNGGNGNQRIQISLTSSSSKLVNELGVYTVDDAAGTIGGIAPGAAGYTEAALARGQVIFSAIANLPKSFTNTNVSDFLQFPNNTNLRFYLVKNSTLENVLAGVTPTTDVLFSDPSNQKITSLGNNAFSLAWKDSSGQNTTEKPNLDVKIQLSNNPLPLGTDLQGLPQGELIDLRAVQQQVNATFVVNREALYNNYGGFYQVMNANGDIDANGTVLHPGDSGYTQAAVRQRIKGIDLTVDNQGEATYTHTLQPGAIFAPFLIANGTPDQVLNGTNNTAPNVFFSFLGANTDKQDHVRLLGNNVFAFEDQLGSGDKDYNDMIMRITLKTTI